MRKHDVRKWLHAILDLLPVILIPVFMIYSHRHTIDSGSIDVPQNQVVDFNQQIKNGNFEDSTYYSVSDGTISVSNNTLNVTNINTGNIFQIFISQNFICNYGDKIYIKYYYNCTELNNFSGTAPTIVYNNTTYIGFDFNQNIIGTYNDIITFSEDASHTFTLLLSFNNFSSQSLSGNVLSISNLQFFNLTTMFGSGNEPTIQQFNQWYGDDYYEYTLSRKELLKGISTITFDDTDIMSQVVYQLYNSVDKYFNMGNVFNLNGVYDWFNLNIFNGNAPISIYIVWNIVLYEFVMDLLFLLYGLFMWFIDMVEKIMDKPFKSIK